MQCTWFMHGCVMHGCLLLGLAPEAVVKTQCAWFLHGGLVPGLAPAAAAGAVVDPSEDSWPQNQRDCWASFSCFQNGFGEADVLDSPALPYLAYSTLPLPGCPAVSASRQGEEVKER